MFVLYIVLALLVLFVAVLLIRTAAFKPKPTVQADETEVSFDREKAVSNLQTLVRFPTVSYRDPSLEDDKAFEDLIACLPQLYPHVFATCSFDRLPDRALLFKWTGKTVGDPAVMMAHYDVVPVDADHWEKPPFDGVLEDGILWGRGTLDTKVTFNGVLTAADHLIASGFQPEHDIYFAFSGGEEINGEGAVHIVRYFQEHNITPSIVVDEGGAVVKGVFPGVSAACGMIGIAEKGLMDVEYRCMSQGGHASAPKPHTPVGLLAKACCAVEANPFKCHITKPVAAMFDTLGRHSTFVYRLIFANLWCFKGVLNLLAKKSGGDMNALLRTTVAFTQMSGSVASNVIPPEATMVSNIRLNPADTIDSALAYLRQTVGDDRIEITALRGVDPSRISLADGPAWDMIAKAVASTWKGCIVTPYLMLQASDSRHYGAISDKVYRFSAMDLTSEERATIHGHNERIRIDCIGRSVEFYIRLMSQC